MSTLCWSRGRVLPRAELGIEPGERAFRYGDGVFATLRLVDGALLDAADHLARLRASAAAVGLAVPEPVRGPGQLAHVLHRLGGDGTADGVVRVQVSAGPGGRGFSRSPLDARPEQKSAAPGAPTSWELVELLPAPGERRLTVAVLEDGEVPLPCLPAVKSCSALAHVLCAAAAARRGTTEAVRVAGGFVLEASAANLFWVIGGSLRTCSAALSIYPGVTRSLVLEVARRERWEVREGEYGPADLTGAEGAFLTNATRGIEPIVEIDGRAVAWPPGLEALRKVVEAARRAAAHRVPSTSDAGRLETGDGSGRGATGP